MERALIFAAAQDALRGKAASAGMLKALRPLLLELCEGFESAAHTVETALMYPALLTLPTYRDELERALLNAHETPKCD